MVKVKKSLLENDDYIKDHYIVYQDISSEKDFIEILDPAKKKRSSFVTKWSYSRKKKEDMSPDEIVQTKVDAKLHIDCAAGYITIKVKGKNELVYVLKFDIKGHRKFKRVETEEFLTEHILIETKNINGHKGFIYGEADIIVFFVENKRYLISRSDLVVFKENNINPNLKPVQVNAKDKKDFLYNNKYLHPITRPRTKDIYVWAKLEHVLSECRHIVIDMDDTNDKTYENEDILKLKENLNEFIDENKKELVDLCKNDKNLIINKHDKDYQKATSTHNALILTKELQYKMFEKLNMKRNGKN